MILDTCDYDFRCSKCIRNQQFLFKMYRKCKKIHSQGLHPCTTNVFCTPWTPSAKRREEGCTLHAFTQERGGEGCMSGPSLTPERQTKSKQSFDNGYILL